MSSRKRSPKATWVNPSATAARHAAAMRSSYTSFGQGDGIETMMSGRPAASACRRSSSVRTPCIATRSAASLIVVSSAAGVPIRSLRSTWSIQALSLPLLQDTRIFISANASGCRVLAMSSVPSATRGPGTTVRGSVMMAMRPVRTAGTDGRACQTAISFRCSSSGMSPDRSSRMTSGRRDRMSSDVACTDCCFTSAKTLSPPAAVSMSWRKPKPPLA